MWRSKLYIMEGMGFGLSVAPKAMDLIIKWVTLLYIACHTVARHEFYIRTHATLFVFCLHHADEELLFLAVFYLFIKGPCAAKACLQVKIFENRFLAYLCCTRSGG